MPTRTPTPGSDTSWPRRAKVLSVKATRLALAALIGIVAFTTLVLVVRNASRGETKPVVLELDTPLVTGDAATVGATRAARDSLSGAPLALADFEVRVVRKLDGTPVPQAEVWAMAWNRKGLSEGDRDWFEQRLKRDDHEAIALRLGARHETDAEGVATVHDPDGVVFLFARSGMSKGSVFSSKPRARPTTITIDERIDLLVCAVDSGDRPWFGIPFRLEWGTEYESIVEDLVELSDPALWHRRDYPAWLRAHPEVHAARIVGRAPLLPKLEHSFDPHRLGPDPKLRLPLPAFGSVIVTIGKPYETTKLDHVILEALWADGRTTREARYLVEGRVTFPLVGTGLRLRASAELDRDSAEPFEFAGPLRDGQSVTITLR